ncbi:MAG: hypothetical protein ACI4LP_03330 [Anaerovoracaceae bacterium]
MRKILRITAALLLLFMVSATPAAGASRYSDRYVDGDIHFQLKYPDKASCVLTMRPLENIEETETFNFDLSGGEKGEYFSVEFTENKSESTFFKRTTDVQIEYNLEPVIGETELNVSVSAGFMASVYDRGLSLYGDGEKVEGDEEELYPLDREKMTGQAASLSFRIVRPAPSAYIAVACITAALIAVVCLCTRRRKK